MRSLVRIENNRVVYENPRDYSGVIDLEDLSHRTNYRVSELARVLGLSTRQLQRDFNDGLGITPKYWLREQRMRHVYALRVDASKFSYRNIGMYLYFNELCVSKRDAHCKATYFRPR